MNNQDFERALDNADIDELAERDAELAKSLSDSPDRSDMIEALVRDMENWTIQDLLSYAQDIMEEHLSDMEDEAIVRRYKEMIANRKALQGE